jgi:glycosyltransferase involved in cell wall biosynthesis
MAKASNMHLSIVIPAWNEEKLLPATLTALREAVRPLAEAGLTHEVIVCDNNSTDRTAGIAAEHGARLI